MNASLVLAPPPRAIPLSLRLTVLFGGVLMLIGWLLLTVTLPIAAGISTQCEPWADPFADRVTRLRGTVIAVEPTLTTVNRRRVMEIEFEFDADGTPRRGKSYTTGVTPEVGAEVPLERALVADGPVRVVGASTHSLPAGLRALWVLPLIAGVLLVTGLVLNLRRLRLLANGAVAEGRLVASAATNTKINNQRVYRLTFAFTDAMGRAREAAIRTHRVQNVTDQATETLLYDADRDRAVLLDQLSPRPRVDDRGELLPAPFGAVALALLGPTLVAIAWSIANAVLAA